MASDRLRALVAKDTDDGNVGVIMASLPKRNELPVFAKLNMTRLLGAEFRRVLREILGGLTRFAASDGDLILREHDPGSKPESHELEWIDVSTQPDLSEYIAAIPALADAQVFDGDDEFVRNLHAYVLVLELPDGERILAFRKYNAKKELGRSVYFGAIMADGQFDRIREPVFLFDDDADCVFFHGILFVKSQYQFQLVFQFFEMLRVVADDCLTQIGEAVPMANFGQFADACKSHRNKLAKLRNIAAKPYLKTVTMEDIKQTIAVFKIEGVRIVEKNGVEVLEYDHKERWAVLKLLDDDYLGSIMTKQKYEVNSKRQMG